MTTTNRPLVTLPAGSNKVIIDQHEIEIVSVLADPQIVVFNNFLSSTECDELIEYASTRLTVSTVVSDTGVSATHSARTSQGTFFHRSQTPLVDRIEKRIATLLNWPQDHGEGIQILNYQPGGEYRSHFDYFDPARPGSGVHLARGGQRFGTFIMYLNSPESGGHTAFTRLGLTVAPKKGSAVFFADVDQNLQVDPRSEHAGMPVIVGEKWIATKWLREKKFI